MVVGLTVPNRPPVAMAGPDQVLVAGETAALDGSASFDPDGAIVSWRWLLPDGSEADDAAAVVPLPVAGRYEATLRVTDDRATTATDTVVLSVVTPSDAIRSLVDEVRGIALPPNVANGLVAKLRDAAAALDRGRVNVAVNKLDDFIAQVEAFRGKRLTDADADLLTAEALRILAVLR
jgi:hypothetical protein